MKQRVLVTLGVVLLVAMVVARPGGADETNAPAKFLIVAPKSFHAALGDFVAHKQQQLPTRLVALEDVLAASKGVDDAEKLKTHLYQAWKAGTRFVLLVGDVDLLPVRYMVLDRVTPQAFDYAFYPSDLYYADLAKADGSFDDWNAAKSGFHAGYFGEVRGEKNKKEPINFDQIDYRPELAVGRWPVSTEGELRTVIKKSLAHEASQQSGKKPGANTLAIFAVDGWVDSRPLLRQLAEKAQKNWDVKPYLYGEKPGPSEKELYQVLGSGAGLVLHTGHGESNRWDGCCTWAGLAKVKNGDRLPILFSAGCSTAYFASLGPYEDYLDQNGKEHKGTNSGEVFNEPPPPPACYQKGRFNRTGLGELALKAGPGGCIAYIGCNTGSQPCGLSLLEGFTLHVAATPDTTLGESWQAALRHYWKKERLADLKPDEGWYPPSIFFQGMKFMVFGDPTLKVQPVKTRPGA